jgi:hypothetical protein
MCHQPNCEWRAPKSQVNPKLGRSHSNCGIFGLGARSQLPALKGVRGACWKFQDRIRRRTSLLNYTVLHPNPTNKLVRIHSTPFWCWDKPRATLDSLDSPRPRFEGSHHLPPHNILCSSCCTCIQMALFPETPKVESRNCPGLDFRDFGRS